MSLVEFSHAHFKGNKHGTASLFVNGKLDAHEHHGVNLLFELIIIKSLILRPTFKVTKNVVTVALVSTSYEAVLGTFYNL